MTRLEALKMLTDLEKQVNFCRELLETSTTEEQKKTFSNQLEQAEEAINNFLADNF